MLLSPYDSRGGVEPLVALAVRLRELGAGVRVCNSARAKRPAHPAAFRACAGSTSYSPASNGPTISPQACAIAADAGTASTASRVTTRSDRAGPPTLHDREDLSGSRHGKVLTIMEMGAGSRVTNLGSELTT